MPMKFSTPTKKLAYEYIAKWKKDLILVRNNEALDKLFKKIYPNNTDIKEVLTKVLPLNSLFSARVRDKDIQKVAETIASFPNIDTRLKKGDLTLVNDLCNAFEKAGLLRYQSFASKYCAFHNPQAFPPYDHFVRNVLQQYCRQGVLKSIRITALDDYDVYVSALQQIKTNYEISCDFRELDHWLWLMGKGVQLP